MAAMDIEDVPDDEKADENAPDLMIGSGLSTLLGHVRFAGHRDRPKWSRSP
jgi:hypothetical protein